MTLLRNFIGFAALALMLFSCKKELSDEDGKIPGQIDAQWEFQEAGTVFSGSMDSGFVQNVNGINTLTLLGTAGGGVDGRIVLQVAANTIQPGNYTNSQVFFQYTSNGNIRYQNSPLQSQDFTISITEMDSVSVTGTFSGTVQDSSGAAKTITDGKFTATLVGAAPIGGEKGSLTVWTSQLCSGAPVDVLVNGFTGQILQASATEPACGAPGTANFELPVGIYEVTAVCGADSSFYQVIINPNGCTSLEIEFGAPPLMDTYLPLTLGTSWEYTDLDNSANKHTVTIDGEEILDGQLYRRATSSLPEKQYYRVEGDDYYQFDTLDFQGSVTNPPTIHLPILKDNAAQGESWETPTYDVTFSGIDVTIKLVMTIADRDFAANINGRLYQNLIQVNTELLAAPRGTAVFESAAAYSTVFSRGVGIVYYGDLSRETEWQLTSSNIIPE